MVRPESDRLIGGSRNPLWILQGAVSLLLLIGCANVANLLMARATGRAREFALRSALGASRQALIRQLLLESIALALLAAAGGVILAVGVLRIILPMAGNSIPRIALARLDGRVLTYCIAVAVVTSLLFSIAPLLQVLRTDASGVLKAAAGNIARGRHRLRDGLVVAQIMSGLVLLVAAELLIAGFLHLWNRDPGFRSDHLLTFDIGLSDTKYKVASQIAFSDALLDRLRGIPGVQAAVTGRPLPLTGHEMTVGFDIEERRAAPSDRPRSDMAIVTPGYFGAMGIPLRKGRDFTERDDTAAPRVLIVNEAFARKFFPREDVIGKRIQPGATNGREGTQSREIVGVVGDARQDALGTGSDPIYYFPYKQLSWGIGTIVLRTAGAPEQVEAAARSVLASVDPEAPMFQVRTGYGIAARAVAAPLFATVLMGSFAATALLLTVGGLYGVLSYGVARRRRELGVRIALGAGRREVVTLVLRDAMRLVVAGLMPGVAIATGGARLLSSMVFGVQPGTTQILAVACGLMVVTGVGAAYLPAARAAAVDPIETLRSE
jgi:predicted permease